MHSDSWTLSQRFSTTAINPWYLLCSEWCQIWFQNVIHISQIILYLLVKFIHHLESILYSDWCVDIRQRVIMIIIKFGVKCQWDCKWQGYVLSRDLSGSRCPQIRYFQVMITLTFRNCQFDGLSIHFRFDNIVKLSINVSHVHGFKANDCNWNCS